MVFYICLGFGVGSLVGDFIGLGLRILNLFREIIRNLFLFLFNWLGFDRYDIIFV